MSAIKQFRKQNRQEVLLSNNQQLMMSLSGVAAVLAEYANGSNWAYKEKQYIWIGEQKPDDMAMLALKRTFGPDALSQIAKKVIGDGQKPN